MKVQLLLSLLILSVSVNAQKTGFSSFSAASAVHTNDDGKTFIYAIGEPINTYSENDDSQILQGLLHSDIAAQESDRAVIQVRVYIDTNKNGQKEPDEQYITQGKIRVRDGLIHMFTNKDGINYYAEPGTYSFTYIIENEIMGYTTSSSEEVEITAGDIYKKVDFGIAPEEVIESAEIYFSLEPFRCFRPIDNVMTLENTGGAKLQKTIYLEIDDRIEEIFFPLTPDVLVSDHLVGWNICLEPGQRTHINFTVTAPGVTSPDDIGEAYKLKAWIDLQNNLTEERTLRRRSWILRCAYDPNDKLVVPDRPDSLALADKELVYTVRFQNTGNDVADDVVVVDTLDSNLDMSTFDVINSSHPQQLEVLIDPREDHIVNFQFKNVFLPDSTTNEPASNGHVTYRIKALEGTPLNTEIENTAHIYFDFNPAIVTNTTRSTLVDTFPIPKEDITIEYTKIICEGEAYEGYSTAGEYRDVFPHPSGYDSIRLLKLITLAPQIETISKEICQGSSFLGYDETGSYRDTLSALACGKIRELDLVVHESYHSFEQVELCRNETYAGYSNAGLIVNRYKTVHGCDSIHTIELIVDQKHTNTEVREICNGESYEGYDETGTYEDIFVASNGCDSLRILQLSVIDRITENLNIEICGDESYEGYDETGIYEDYFITQSGCDSIRTVSLTVLDLADENIEIEICEGESYEGYSSTGIYEDVYTGINGCDSVRTIDLLVLENRAESITVEICEGDTHEGYSTTGLYEDSFLASNGCDSLRTLELTVLNTISETLEVELCEGDNYEGYTTTGTYEDTFAGSNGCDSLRTVTLAVLSNTSETLAAEICAGESYEGYTTTGSFEDNFIASNGCDSLRTLNLTVLNTSFESQDIEICAGEDYEGHTATGTYEERFIGSNGCDSLRVINLEVLQNSESLEEIFLCIGEEYEGYDEEGLFSSSHLNADGCDSIRYIQITKIDRDDPICAYQYDSEPKAFGETAFLELYPNPTSDFIDLIVTKPDRLPAQLEILSIHRKRILLQGVTTERTSIDLSPYSSGVYIFILRNGHNIYIQRVLKS